MRNPVALFCKRPLYSIKTHSPLPWIKVRLRFGAGAQEPFTANRDPASLFPASGCQLVGVGACGARARVCFRVLAHQRGRPMRRICMSCPAKQAAWMHPLVRRRLPSCSAEERDTRLSYCLTISFDSREGDACLAPRFLGGIGSSRAFASKCNLFSSIPSEDRQ